MRWGSDRSLPLQYVEWIGRALRGDFGISIATGRSVGSLLAGAWPATAFLVIVSLSLTYLIGIAVGTWQANTRHRATDTWLTAGTVALNAMPGYWLGLVLVIVFTYRLRLLPAFGASGLDADFLSFGGKVADHLRHLALPLLTLTLIGIGGTARFVRAAMRDPKCAMRRTWSSLGPRVSVRSVR